MTSRTTPTFLRALLRPATGTANAGTGARQMPAASTAQSRLLSTTTIPTAASPTMTTTTTTTPSITRLRAQTSNARAAIARTQQLQQQRRCLSGAMRSAIDQAVGTAPVVLFMKGTPEFPQCGFSRVSIQILGLQAVDPRKFTAFNVLEDEELRAGIKEYSDWPTIPQLYVNKEFIGGSDILMSMHQNGELAKLLEENGVVVTDAAEEGGEKS